MLPARARASLVMSALCTPYNQAHSPPACLPTCLPAPPLQGFLLMTPLHQPGTGRAVLVNRGWVPAAWREDGEMRAEGEPAGKVRWPRR